MRHAKTAMVSYRQLSWPHWAVVEQGLRSYPYFCFWQAWARLVNPQLQALTLDARACVFLSQH
jgi:hypothetical protein